MKRWSGRWMIALIQVSTFACSGEVHSLAPENRDAGGGVQEGGADSDSDTMRVCPPAGPYGVKPGDVAPDVALYDCEGATVHLQDLCPSNAAYVYTHAGWCGTCKLFAQSGEANAFFNKYKNEGLTMWFVITSTESGQPPTAETCRAYRDQYGLEMTVLFDPDSVTESALDMLPNSDDMVLSQGNHIELNGSWATETVENVLDSMFEH